MKLFGIIMMFLGSFLACELVAMIWTGQFHSWTIRSGLAGLGMILFGGVFNYESHTRQHH
jgi:hypothetical protein